MFQIYLKGQAEELFDSLAQKVIEGTFNKDDAELYKKIRKALLQLEVNPRYPGLNSHEIDVLSKKYKVRIWESYLENKRSGARRIFWIYGPESQEITIIAIEKHPESGVKAYQNINLEIAPVKKKIKSKKKK